MPAYEMRMHKHRMHRIRMLIIITFFLVVLIYFIYAHTFCYTCSSVLGLKDIDFLHCNPTVIIFSEIFYYDHLIQILAIALLQFPSKVICILCPYLTISSDESKITRSSGKTSFSFRTYIHDEILFMPIQVHMQECF